MYEDEYPVRHRQRTRRKHSKVHYDSVIFKDISMHIFGNTTSENVGVAKTYFSPTDFEMWGGGYSSPATGSHACACANRS